MDISIRTAGPLGQRIEAFERSQTQQTADKDVQTFIDAMKVREKVFVEEQHVPLENELDEDDARSIHVVLYALPLESIVSTPERQPVGTLRILPMPNSLHLELDKHRTIDGEPYNGEARSSLYDGHESFIKVGRLAVRSEYRGRGLADKLVSSAFDFARAQPGKMAEAALTQPPGIAAWQGLILIHAQKQVQKYWAKLGFELDAGFGVWDEEGIDHIAMWKRLALR